MVTLSHKIKAIPIGSQYGSWTVLAYAGEKGNGKNTYWTCECSCGTTKDVCGSLLRAGKSSKCHKCAGRKNGRIGLDRMAKKHLYIVRCGEFFKIGSSDNPDRRIKDLHSTCPYPITVEAILLDRGGEEPEWHEKHRNQHHHGEWFQGEVIW